MLQPFEGRQVVELARGTIDRALAGSLHKDPAEWTESIELGAVFDEPRGVFVTLHRRTDHQLRGCIGIPEPVFPLRLAIPRAAFSAAFEDPRFRPLNPTEGRSVSVEVSLLTVPSPVDATPRSRLPEALRVGTDGLIVRRPPLSGLLLPQVAKEQGWDAAQFLEAACEKAGLDPDAWESPQTQILRFQSDVYEEPD